MTQESELERLEAVVVKLLAKYETLRQVKIDLEDEVATRDMEIEDLQQRLDAAKTERGNVTSRVEGLLDQIEDWEASLEDEEDSPEQSGEGHEDDEDSEFRKQQDLFNDDSQTETNV